MGKNVIIFGADMNLFVQTDDENKNSSILGKRPTRGLDGTTLRVETKYHINFTQPNKRFALTIRYHGSNSFLFVNATKVYQVNAKASEIKNYPLCLCNI